MSDAYRGPVSIVTLRSHARKIVDDGVCGDWRVKILATQLQSNVEGRETG